ncbi:MAG: GTPase [Thiotrichaceae bacterium]|nr:GTPase [Thiotrichaceae bacterium]
MENQPFTVLFFGKTGAGKSSTLNSMFNFNLDVGAAVAVTKVPKPICLTSLDYDLLHHKQIQVVDIPGIGESIEADEYYLPFYKEWIPKTDSLVWVTQADTRAYKRDQIFLLKLLPLFHPSLNFTIALNKIDYFGVNEDEKGFDTSSKQPSQDQLNRLPEKIADVYQVFDSIIEGKVDFKPEQVIPYTSFYGWGLDALKQKILTRR